MSSVELSWTNVYIRKLNIEVSVLAGYNAVSVGNHFPPFKKMQWSYLQGSEYLAFKLWGPIIHRCRVISQKNGNLSYTTVKT
jgi:hypothetical protein